MKRITVTDEELEVIKAHRDKKSKPIYGNIISNDSLLIFAYIATDVKPPFDIPKEWFCKKEVFGPFCSEINIDDLFFNTKYYIQASWGYCLGEGSTSQTYKNIAIGEKLYKWLDKTKYKHKFILFDSRTS